MASSTQNATTRKETVQFLLNGEVVTVKDVSPTKTVLSYLRENLRCTGTKEGCAEGDCGACTVAIAELSGKQIEMKTVNACIQFVPALDGKALFTVEALRGKDGRLHPVQQAMVDCHGSQCGFCTPGFIMSLWNLYLESEARGKRPTETEIRTALTGNLCRCTGYRPILEAGDKMFDLPKVGFDREALRQQLVSLKRDASLAYEYRDSKFFAPQTLEELIELRAAYPNAVILAGSTDVGLWVTKQLRELNEIIYIGEVAELKEIHEHDWVLRIGASVSLTDAYAALAERYPQIIEMWERFASVPIRNAGTLGGNVANGSPIGDSMPWLIALGARVVLRSAKGSRVLPLEDLYLAYMKKAMHADEILEAVEVPLPTPSLTFRTYKLSKRYDSDISAVCAAFAIRLEDNRIVASRVAFGGMAATPKRAARTEAALTGQPWTEQTVRSAMEALAKDYAPLTDMRASAGYRLKTAQNFLYRFFLETRIENPLPARSVSVFAAV